MGVRFPPGVPLYMSTLKQLTAKAHDSAESTPFMRLLIAKAITKEEYMSYVTQFTLIYAGLEHVAKKAGILDEFPGIERLTKIRKDLQILNDETGKVSPIMSSTVNYYNHIINYTERADILGHFYVRYAGDLYGGQMLKSLVPGPGNWYEFDNVQMLREKMRTIATPDLADSAIRAYEFNQYILDDIIFSSKWSHLE